MNATILHLLQATAALLFAAQTHHDALAPALAPQLVSIASRAIQISTQALRPQPEIPEIPSTNIWPNISRLRNSLFMRATGERVRAGNGIQFFEEYTSFGDLNADGLDEAMAMTLEISAEGTPRYALAAFLNQGGILFNIATVSLPHNPIIYSHRIEPGGIFSIELKDESGAKKKLLYKLLGNTLMSV